jgi:hypothetical protein
LPALVAGLVVFGGTTAAVAATVTRAVPLAAPVVAPGAVRMIDPATPRPGAPAGLPAAPPALRVLLYGDSLAWESRAVFERELVGRGAAAVLVQSYGGTAICDWLDDMRTTAVEFRPTVVVLSFSGNNTTPCMTDPATWQPAVGDKLLNAYRVSAAQATDLLVGTGAAVVWATSPPFRPDTPLAERRFLPEVFRAEVQRHPGRVRFVDSGLVLTDGSGGFTDRLPCEPGEPCTDGWVPVRSPDGTHLCPVLHDGGDCPVWSPGADRFGRALAEAALASAWATRPALAGPAPPAA